jgi:hypothetical protein
MDSNQRLLFRIGLLAVAASILALYPSMGRAALGIPSTIKYLYVIQLSHLDIGFTDPQDVVAQGCKETIDDAIWLCQEFPNYKWTIEEIWQLQQWWVRSTPAEKQVLLDLIRQRRIAVTAGYATQHSSVMGHEEINRFLYPAQVLRESLGIPISVIIQDDVPGYAWGLPSVLAKSRVPYMITGTNLWIGGGTSISPGEFPFYWVGPDGDSVLTWISTRTYLEGTFSYGLWSVESAHDSLSLRLPEWEAAGYPYDAILVMGGTGDNGGTSISMTRVADEWNATYDNPRIIIATPEEFFAHLEAQYGREHPSYSGEWGNYWDGGAINTPLSLSLCRQSHDAAMSAEKTATLAMILGAAAYPSGISRDMYMTMLEFDEHSTGGGCWPGMMTPEEVRRQNEIAFGYAQTAWEGAEFVYESSLDTLLGLVRTEDPTLIVFNPLSWTRTEPLRLVLSDSLFSSAFTLLDGVTHVPVPYQIIPETREILFVAEGVPALGFKVFEILPSRPPRVAVSRSLPTREGPRQLRQRMPATIENRFYRLVVDTLEGNIVSFWDKTADRELVDGESDLAFNGLIKALNRQTWAGKYEVVSSGTVTVRQGLAGSVAQSLIIERGDCPLVRTEITLYQDLARADLLNVLDVRRMAYVPYEDGFDYYDFTFPFNLEEFEAHLEIANTFMLPQTDNLPAAAIPYFVTQHGLDLSAADYGITWASREGMVHEFGKINAYATTFDPHRATLLSRVIKHENECEFQGGRVGPFRAEPPGIPLSFHYALTTHGSGFDPVAATRFIWGYSNPLVAREKPPQAAAPLAEPALSLLSLEQPNVMVVNLKKADWGDDVIARLLELSGIPTEARLSSPYFRIEAATRANNVEEDLYPLPVQQNSVVCPMRPRETATIRLRLALPQEASPRR